MERKKVWHDYVNGVGYDGHQVNFIERGESGEERAVFYFLTDLPVTQRTAKELAEAGRRRWAILYELWFYANFSGQKPHTYCIAA